MLGNIVLPEVVQAEINQAQLVRIQAQAKADALNVLGEALGAQPDQAWKKVLEVEAIDALAQNGVPVFHPYSSTYWSGGISRNRTDGNS